MNMTLPEMIYYIQTNVVCMVILIYLLFVNNRRFGNHATEDDIFSEIIFETIIFCIADIFTWCVDGQHFFGAKIIIYLSDCIYISAPPIMSYLWSDYAYVKLKGVRRFGRKRGKIHLFVMFMLLLLIVSSPWTHFAFSIDDANIYHRHFGAYLAPAIAWSYIIGVIISLAVSAQRRKITADKDAIILIIAMFVPTFVATLLQLVFYGLTTIQVGFTLSLLAVFVNRQKNMISLDELTRLNNRRELDLYYKKLLDGGNETEICICVIDVNKFKQINDKYGHIEGDKALKVIASALKASCSAVKGGWFLARFGGDEFVFAGINKAQDDIILLRTAIKKELDKENITGAYPYHISASFGYGIGIVRSAADISSIMAIADERMYEDKGAERR